MDPTWPFLLMYGSHDIRHTGFSPVDGGQLTPRDRGVTCLNDNERKFLQNSTIYEGEQNSVHRIIYAITKHFIGDPRILQERSSEILKNIRCRTLSDFRWYNDVFI